MNLRGLHLLRDIVTTGSLAEAAVRSGLSAPSASRLLSQIEAQLELQLFSRSRRTLALTERGAQLYRQIQNTLNGLDEIPLLAQDLRRQPQNRLTVISAAPLANGLAVPAIAQMWAQVDRPYSWLRRISGPHCARGGFHTDRRGNGAIGIGFGRD